jgi:hypothetical protein
VPLFYAFKETQTLEEGAAHLIKLAEKSNIEINGKYFEGDKKGLFEAKSSEESYNNSVAKQLWEESKKLIGSKMA